MRYEKLADKIIIFDKNEFNPKHVLECGQVFCYNLNNGIYEVFPQNYFCRIVEKADCYEILTEQVSYFENFFDLKTDYDLIKKSLSSFKILEEPLKFGYGIRILKQNLFETLISFIISANNNIKRIKLILNNLRNFFKNENGGEYFPTFDQLISKDIDFFKKMGCGYRADYIYKVLRQISPTLLEDWKDLETAQLRSKLISEF